MGSGPSLAALPAGTCKKIVIVGASFGGRTCCYGLQKCDKGYNLEITFIDKSPHFEFNCTNYKSLCDDATFNHLSEPFENVMRNYNSDPNQKYPVKYVQGKLDSIDHAGSKITVTDVEGGTSEIEYDALVISTGATYVSPWRDAPDQMKSRAERDGDYAKAREEIKAAGKVLIAGAGATGLEAAGFIKEQYPDKEVGVCLRGKTLLPYVKGAHEMVTNYLKEIGVVVHFETPFTPETQAALGYNCTVNCMGFNFEGPKKFMTGDLSNCLTERGQIKVNQFGQVCEKNPLLIDQAPGADNGKVYDKIFCIGDVCFTPAAENKSIVSMYQYVPQVASNIYQALCGSSRASFLPIPMEFSHFQLIPMGTKMSLMTFNNFVKMEPDGQKMKNDMERDTMEAIRGNSAKLAEDKKKLKDMPGLFNAMRMACCCCCCPMHYSKRRATDRGTLKKLRDEAIQNAAQQNQKSNQ